MMHWFQQCQSFHRERAYDALDLLTRGPPPPRHFQTCLEAHTVGKREVGILLECFLVEM